MRRIPLTPQGWMIEIAYFLVVVGISSLLWLWKWWGGMAFLLLGVSFFLFIQIGLRRHLDEWEEHNKKNREWAEAHGYTVQELSEKDFKNSDKIGGFILKDGTPVSKKEIKYID